MAITRTFTGFVGNQAWPNKDNALRSNRNNGLKYFLKQKSYYHSYVSSDILLLFQMEISPLCSNRLKSWCPKFSHAVAKRKQKSPELSRVTCQNLPCVKPKTTLKFIQFIQTYVCYRIINGKKDEQILKSNFCVYVNSMLKCLFKFIYSEKATKFCEIFTLLLTGTT